MKKKKNLCGVRHAGDVMPTPGASCWKRCSEMQRECQVLSRCIADLMHLSQQYQFPVIDFPHKTMVKEEDLSAIEIYGKGNKVKNEKPL